jgi:hypothetical protein
MRVLRGLAGAGLLGLARMAARWPHGAAAAVWRGVLLALLAGAWGPAAQAQTQVSGAIASDTHWTLSGSPYVVVADVVVQGGAALTIDAGVTVFMAANTRLSVQAGTLRALGSAASPVRVLSDRTRLGETAAPGDWDQWVLGPGTSAATRLEHVLFEHGRGLAVQGSAPVLNHLDIRNQQGAAITVDLAASPTGVGNRASGNALNGISVPAGTITGTTRWGLRGIPYVVTAGTVSVGTAPAISGVTPATVEQGQTVTFTVNGQRLGGVTAAAFDQPGLTLTPFSGGSSGQAFFQLAVSAGAPTGPASLRLTVDAGEVLLQNAITVTPPMPGITSLEPASVVAGVGPTTLTVTGRNFVAASEVTVNAAALPTEFVSATQLRATLPMQTATGTLQVQVRSPNAQQPGQPLLSNTVGLAVQPPIPPVATIEPTPIALPPDSSAREITVRLSKADFRDHTLNFSISDTSKATVSPPSLVIPAGQTSARITIVPRQSGTVSLVMESPTLARVSVPLFITVDFRGANTSYAAPVGVVVQSNAGPVTEQRLVAHPVVGVTVGAALTGVSPSAWPVGSTPVLTIQGTGIPANAQVLVVPGTGITVGAVTVSPDGTQLQAALATAADASPGPRRLVVRDGAGKDLVFTDPARAQLQLMTGLPAIESIEPLQGARGTRLQLLVRGQHLQQGSLRLLPGSGLRVDTVPAISADGRTLSVLVEIDADAPTGSRVVQVVTPAGASTAAALPANSFAVVSQIRGAVTPIASALIGVVVGDATPPPRTATMQPASVLVGVLAGAGITDVQPRTAVIATETQVTVRGAGLQTVDGVSFVPATGLSLVGAPQANEAGTELRFTVRAEANAPLGLRRLVLSVGNRPVTYVRPTDATLLVAAPIPELVAVEPQVMRVGQGTVRLSLRGRNFINVTGARLEPSAGIAVNGPFEASADGSTLSFDAIIGAAAAPGVHTVVITSAAGESSAVPVPGNTVRIAAQVGPTYANVLTSVVGVVNGQVTLPPQTFDTTPASSLVGVVVGEPPAPEPVSRTVAAGPVGVVVGSAVRSLSPGGWLRGASGTILIEGQGLDAVASVTVAPATGLLLGSPVAGEGGTRLEVPVSVAPDAPEVVRVLRLRNAAGTEVLFTQPEANRFGIGSLPVMTSLSPIVFEQGKGATLVVRGSNLRGVTRIVFAPAGGLSADTGFSWSQDALGELLTIPVSVAATAPLGNRVVRLQVYGGTTSGEATPANTINVVAPQ